MGQVSRHKPQLQAFNFKVYIIYIIISAISSFNLHK